MEPDGFKIKSVSDMINSPQYGDARTSSGFAALEKITLQPGESISIASFYGKADHIEDVPAIAKHITKAGYVGEKYRLARSMIDDLTSSVETKTTNHLFDGAVKQMFLDNSLRGGMPFVLGDVDTDAKYSNYDEDDRVKVFHAFSRIHGDLERDYNAFFIDDTYFSQGHGNFRDVAQNRRDDVTFTPRIGSFDVQMFLSFIQADAYKPLTVEAVVYSIKDKNVAAQIAAESTSDAKSAETLTDVLNGGSSISAPFRQMLLDAEGKVGPNFGNLDLNSFCSGELYERTACYLVLKGMVAHWEKKVRDAEYVEATPETQNNFIDLLMTGDPKRYLPDPPIIFRYNECIRITLMAQNMTSQFANTPELYDDLPPEVRFVESASFYIVSSYYRITLFFQIALFFRTVLLFRILL